MVEENQHLFIIEDQAKKKVKFMGIGAVGQAELKVFKIRFKNEFLVCWNKDTDEELMFRPSIRNIECEEIETAQKFTKLEKPIKDEVSFPTRASVISTAQ